MFTMYVNPLANTPYERCIFNTRNQKESETFDQYLTELRKLSNSCKFDTITPDEILRDRLILGLKNEKIKKRLLKDNELTLVTLIRICQSEEINLHQNNILYTEETVHQMKKNYQKKQMYSNDVQQNRNDSNNKQIKKLSKCKYCGLEHIWKKVKCPAYKKTFGKCGELNHFKIMYRNKENKHELHCIYTMKNE